MKSIPKKFQFMILGKSPRQSIILNINNIKIKESSSGVLLDLTIDNRLTFKDHINMLPRTASFKLHALRRIKKNSTTDKAKLLYKAFIKSQFNYASIIWMFCQKQDYLYLFITVMNLMRNSFYITTKFKFIKSSYFYWLLRFLKTFFKKVFINLDYMKSYFTIKEISNCLRNGNLLKIPSARATHYGTN